MDYDKLLRQAAQKDAEKSSAGAAVTETRTEQSSASSVKSTGNNTYDKLLSQAAAADASKATAAQTQTAAKKNTTTTTTTDTAKRRTLAEIIADTQAKTKERNAAMQETQAVVGFNADKAADTKLEQDARVAALASDIKKLRQEYNATAPIEAAETGKRTATLKDLTLNSVVQGYDTSNYGKASFNDMLNGTNTAAAQKENLETNELYQFVPTKWWQQGLSGAGNLIGQQVNQATDKRTLALAGTAGAAAAIAGKLGPQALVPEEVVTVPAAVIAAWKAGSAVNNFEIEAGLAYQEMLDNGVSKETARKIALGVGGVNAALEGLQLDELLKAGKALEGTGSKALSKQIAAAIGKAAISTAKETAQEVAQEATTIAGTQYATKKDTGEAAYTPQEIGQRLKDTAVQSALSFAVMGAPGTVRSVVASRNAQTDAPQGAAQRNAAQTTTDTTQTEAGAEAQKTAAKAKSENAAVRAAQEGYEAVGSVSNNAAERIIKDPAAMAELGVDAAGKTMSQLRGEVKTAVQQTMREEGAADQVVSVMQREAAQQMADDYIATLPNFNAEESTQPRVENRNFVDAPAAEAYNNSVSNETEGGAERGTADEFGAIQERSRRELEQVSWSDRGSEVYGSVREGLPAVLRGELERRGFNGGTAKWHLSNGDRTFDVNEVDGQTFRDIFEVARTYTKNGELVDLHGVQTTEDGIGYSECRNFLSADGTSGFSITPDGDLISVFNLGINPGWLRSIAPIVKENVKTLDCYKSEQLDLPALYEKIFGMQVASLMDNNPKYDHDNINANHGSPKVAFMVNTPSKVETKTFGKEDYDGAKAYQEAAAKGAVTKTEGTANDGAGANQRAERAGNENVRGSGGESRGAFSAEDGRAAAEARTAEDGLGAANRDFGTPGVTREERSGRLKDTALPYNRITGEAAGMNRQEYEALFRYMSQPEAVTEHAAETMLWYERDGERVFLADLDPEGFAELKAYLQNKDVWNAVDVDAGMMIEQELRRRSYEGEGTSDDFLEWLDTVNKHARESGRSTQAFAKWSRSDNDTGAATEREAERNLEDSALTPEQRAERMHLIVLFDRDISQAKNDDEIIDIVLRIADERGTTRGITGKQSKLLNAIARSSLRSMDSVQLKQFAYAASAALSTDAQPADFGQKLKTLQIMNMLSSPKTAAKNLSGNTTFFGLDTVAMRGAALLDMALSKITGTRSTAFEQSAFGKESRQEIAKAISLSVAEITMDVDMGSQNRYGQGTHRTFKENGAGVFGTNTAADKFAERVLSVCERNMGYLMTTTDEAYKGAARATAKGTQKLINEGKIKTANREYAAEQAQQLATYRTFQGHGIPTAAIQMLHDVGNLVGIGDSGKAYKAGDIQFTIHAFGLGDLVAPFTRVAGNLASVGLDYSPVNAIKGTAEILNCVKNAALKRSVDPAKQAKAVSNMARGLTGSAVAYGIMVLAKAGLVKRADDEDDEDIAALNKSEGMTGTQVNIDAINRWINGGSQSWQDGDTLIDTSNLEPINFIISLGVELADNGTEGFLSTVGNVKAVKDTFVSAANTAGDLPVLSSVGDLAKDIFVYKKEPLAAAGEVLGKTAISSVTPNIVAALAKGLDDRQRNLYAGDGVDDVLLSTLKSRIPGVRETLPTTVDTSGKEKSNPGNAAERILNAMLNPIGVNEYTQSEMSKEMQRIREETGIKDFYPTTRKPSTLSYTDGNGETHEVELSYEEQQQFQTTASETQIAAVNALLASPAYKKASDKEKAALLERADDYAYQVAKGEVLGKDAMEKWALNSQTAQKDIGVSQSEYFALYEKYGDDIFANGNTYNKTKRMVKAGLTVAEWVRMKNNVDTDGNGYTKKQELMDYLDANFPYAERSKLFDAYKGNQNWKNPY